MRKVLPSALTRPTRLATAAALVLAVSAGACSTDVQRFGYTSSITPAASEPVRGAPLEPVAGTALDQPDRYVALSNRHRGGAIAGSSNAARGGFVTVRSADTMFSIAQANGVTVEELARANQLSYPYNIRVGQQLALPGGAADARATAPTAIAGRQAGGSHVVEPGETLYSISRRYGVGVGAIADANNLDDYGSIKIGQSLAIPAAGAPRAEGGPLQTVARDTGTRSDAPRVFEARRVQEQPAERVAAADPNAPLPNPPQLASGQFRWPVRGRIISHYGVAADGNRNDGINIAVPEGASVKAAENGIVAYAGNELKGYGNLVLIRHANDWVTAYAHNSQILVRRGDTVQRGQIIAKAGQTGSVDQPQVHFEVRRGSKAVDPMGHLEGA